LNKVSINPDLLKWARESSNLSINEVALKLKKDVEVIKAWEEGQDSPTYLQLEKLAYELYKRPIAVFFFPQPPVEETPQKSFRTIPEVEYKKLPSSLVKQFRKAQVMQINLRELCGEKNPADKQIIKDLSFSINVNVDQSVDVVRNYLGIDLEQQKSWRNYDLWRENLSNKELIWIEALGIITKVSLREIEGARIGGKFVDG
jgi:transcriptional regulator with XRE-family HTH domain